MDDSTEIQLKAGAALLALVLFAVARLGPVRRVRGLETGLHAVAAAIGVLAFFNFGFFRHHSDEGFVNLWEHFHYRLGSKYFPELGYDGLYAASLAAQAESAPWIPVQPIVRDLRDYSAVPTITFRPFVEEVRGRFSPERWAEFLADHEAFLHLLPPDTLADIRLDHGYNPTPAWTFTAQLFGGRLGSGPASLRFLASLDVVLLLALFAAVFRSFGTRTGCLAVAICGLGYGWRYNYLGAFLRLDWLAAVVFGLCCLRRRRPGLAGLCLGWAAALRVFPVLFLLGPGVLALRQLLRGELPAWAIRLASGFTAALTVGLVAGFFTGRGPEAWVEFAAKIDLHRDSWASTRVGMDNVLLNGPALLEGVAAGRVPELESLERAEVQGVLAARRPVSLLVKGAVFTVLSLALVRATLVESAVLGLVTIFLLTPLGSYYWIMLLAVPLRREPAALAVLGLSAALWGIHAVLPGREWHELRFALLSAGLAVFFVGWILPEALRAIGGGPAARALAAGLVVIVLGCGGPARKGPPPNLLLYVVDTLRADSLGCYGNPRVETPRVDGLAAEGVLFENAFANASWTRPSMASLFTGLHPERHGVQDREHVLPESAATLAASLGRHGFHTGFLTANPNAGRFYGLGAGFGSIEELFDERGRGRVRSQASDQVSRAALRWIDAAPQPFFLAVLSIDPHAPYVPPPLFDRYGQGLRSRARGDLGWLARGNLAEADRRRIRSLYDAEVSFNDDSFGHLLDGLRERGLLEHTLVVFTSDHGEEFWEHAGRRGHGRSLAESVLRVPLVLRLPDATSDRSGVRVQEPVALVDVMPTLLALLGLPVPEGLDGRPLLSGDGAAQRPLWASLSFNGRRQRALRDPPWKLVQDIDAGRFLLYDLGKGEDAPVAAEPGSEAAVVEERLRTELLALAAREPVVAGASSAGPPPPDLEAALEALGYVETRQEEPTP